MREIVFPDGSFLQARDLPPGHICCCAQCDPTLAPRGPRQGTLLAHTACRFGDCTQDYIGRWEITLDGVVVQNSYEAIAGAQGHIWRYSEDVQGEKHACEVCGRGACAEHLQGVVTIALLGSARV